MDDDSDDVEFGLAIAKIHEGNAAAEQPIVVDVTIADVPVQMEVDNGAFVTILSQKEYTRFFAHIPLRKSQHLLHGHRIEVAREFTAHVTHNGQEAELPNVVARTERDALPLWGRNWLAVMRLDCKSLFPRATAIHKVQVEQVANPAHRKDRYPDVFREELGTLRGVNTKLHLEPDVVPKFCKPRPVPFALRPAVKRELEGMEKEGFLEPVKFSEWATPLVCVPKPNGTVRLCGDCKVTGNPALHVDQQPILTLEQAFGGLAHGQRFTKIDLKSAYQQLVLDQASKESW